MNNKGLQKLFGITKYALDQIENPECIYSLGYGVDGHIATADVGAFVIPKNHVVQVIFKRRYTKSTKKPK